MVEWSKALSVATSGIVSVFLALGILQITITISGYSFSQAQKRKAAKIKSSTGNMIVSDAVISTHE
ncbi:hypothetical protein DCCM_4387 [Desulfocucumis palustris]|uniref:Uncharacterized protein n=1 Tax=Desulfocucumis palustris TaxID=1898651 RepID=A0A2L2XGZ3_9FIRM|nr:hypothetical protein [Desulfocucumis palustris]GBF35264.1 hypothetical protein DCCM_4387 [Desulfocucumis palustris]